MSLAKHLAYVVLLSTIACHKSHPAGTSDSATPVIDVASTTDTTAPAKKPNIVFIMTDDLDDGVYSHMTRLPQMMDAFGMKFRNHFLNISLCCPSRTAILRGQYAQNTKIFSNGPPNGGFETFYANGSEAQTLPVFMTAAGYRTVLMGKYLNGYPNTAPTTTYIPPGWSEFYSPNDGDPYSEYNYTLNENGVSVPYGHDTTDYTGDYLVDVLSRKAATFITAAAANPDGKPFFMYITPYVPHAPATVPTRYLNDFPNAQAPRTPSFNEADVSDKPPWDASLPLLTTAQIKDIDMLYGRRLRSMEAAEDLVKNVIDTLTATGTLDNTYIIFTSDNGFHQGQHRLQSGKNTEFDEDLRVPLIIRGPGIPAGTTVDLPTLNVDFTPTFVDLGGGTIPATVDGRSLVPLLGGGTPTDWRQMVFLEHAAEVGDGDSDPNADRAPIGTMEPGDQLLAPPPAGESPPAFEGVRTANYTYVKYDDGTQELYDHNADPDQLTNIGLTADPALLAQLSGLVQSMHGCNGAACRSAESAPAP